MILTAPNLRQHRIILRADTASEECQLRSKSTENTLCCEGERRLRRMKRTGAGAAVAECEGRPSPEARCGHRNPSLSSIFATQMVRRSRRSFGFWRVGPHLSASENGERQMQAVRGLQPNERACFAGWRALSPPSGAQGVSRELCGIALRTVRPDPCVHKMPGAKRENRACLCGCQGETRYALYAVQRLGPGYQLGEA